MRALGELKIASRRSFRCGGAQPAAARCLDQERQVVAASRAVIGRIGLGAAVKAGTPKPDISTVDRFKAALLATKGVAYPGEGASGRYFASLVERMGIGEQMKPKMRPMAAEDTVEVRIVAYDLNLPDLVDKLKKVGKRLKIIIDDSAEHGTSHSAETQAAKLLMKSAGKRTCFAST